MPKSLKVLTQQRSGYRLNVEKQFLTFDSLKTKLESPETIQELTILSEKLKQYNDSIETLNSEILELIDENDEDSLVDEVKTSSDLREKIMDVVHRSSTLISNQMSKKLAQSPDRDDNSSTQFRNTCKLPKLEIEKFSGDPLHWQSFWDSFDSTIHSNTELSDVDKFKYLKRYLDGNALNTVQGYMLTSSNYGTVIEALKQRYGNPELAIFAHLEQLLALQSCEKDYSKLQKTYDDCEKHIRSLVALGLTEDTFGQIFTPIILSKLPRPVRIELHRRNESKPWKLSRLRDLMRDEIKAREMSECYLKYDSTNSNKQTKSNSTENNKSQRPQPMTQSALSSQDNSKVRCSYCNEAHFADKCTEFATLEDRKSALNGKCFKCLKEGHIAEDCEKDNTCYYCKKDSHHSSLCRTKFGTKSDTVQKGGSRNGPKGGGRQNETQDTTMLSASNKVQMQMAVVTIQNGSHSAEARVFFDTGSTRSYVKTSLVQKLRLPHFGEDFISVAKFANRKRQTRKYKRTEVPIVIETGDSVPVAALVTDVITCPIQKHPISASNNIILKDLHLADPPVSQPVQVEIDILIGADHYYDFIGGEQIHLSGGAVLLQSKLGYIISGRIQESDEARSSSDDAVMLFRESTDIQTASNLERFWALEDVGIKDSPYQVDDDRALEMFNKTIKFEQGRYQVTWPWKDTNCELPTNYGLAFGRLKSLLNKIQKNPDIIQRYDATIQEQLNNDIIEPVDPNNTKQNGRIHYLPHHCVIRQNKATTKLRVVYDASAKCSKTAQSFNECLLRGPVLLHDLCGMLLRFRLSPIALSCDVEKAFLQIGLQPSERDVTRFLWLKDVTKPLTPFNLTIYRFCRVLFGAKPSPFLLTGTIRHHFQQQDSKISQDINNNTYVDNVLGGRNSTTEVEEFYQEAKQQFSSIGMNIREWYSNSVKFISGLPQSDLGKDTSPKVLGLKWNTTKDMLSCSGIAGETEPNTKRQILQAVAQVYDPCGWLTPVVIKGKILIQQLWKTNFDWDDSLPAEVTHQFKTIKHDLEKLSSVEVPRYIEGFSGSDPIGYEIHVFSDASAKAYASACYVRVLRSGQSPRSTLIFSKARLAPIKPVSIPRLELMAVVLGVRMVQFVAKELHICPSSRFIWTDSKCVLHWLISSKQYPVFVQNRINEIKRVDDILFRFVPTQCNPADLPTRGIDLMELQSLELWWNGPHFLVLQEAFWPETVTSADEPIQEETSVVLCAPLQPPEGIGYIIDPNNYSSFMKLLRVTAYVNRFISNCARKTTDRVLTVLTRSELGRAEQMWVRSEQRLMFPDGLQAAKNSTTVIRIGLIEGDTGLIRCKGRLEYADLPEAAKQPLILRKNSKVSDLIIDQCHKTLLHGGDRQTLALLRLKYWIPQGMSQVKRNRKKCYICQKAEGGPFRMPESPPLPQFRVTRSLPFEHTGIDYLGPLFVKSTGEQTTSITKVWICLFTCSVIRAIHLEVVSDCTAEQFLMCLKRFSALYGKPSSIISDNAKCFKSTQSLLHEISRNDTVQVYSSAEGIQWHFIPELAPWMGGFYERLVQSVKKVLRKTLGNKCFNLIELQTLVIEVSSVVNSRPLIPVNSEDKEEVITPAHFLSKQGRMGLPDLEVNDDPQFTIGYISKARENLLNTWLKGQRHLDSFWTCWRNEYLAQLRERPPPKWKSRNSNAMVPTVGSTVLIKDNVPRCRWKIGRVDAIDYSKDGACRSVTVRLPSGTRIKRAVNYLYPLETDSGGKELSSSDPKESDSTLPTSRMNVPRQAAIRARELVRTHLLNASQ